MTPSHCSAHDAGMRCPQPSEIVDPVSLCKRHSLELAAILLPRVLKSALNRMVDLAAAEADWWADAMLLVDSAESIHPNVVLDSRSHDPVVYVLTNGASRVKIGTSRSLRSRITNLSLRSGDLVCVLRGGRELEKAMHLKFSADRVGDTEWFELGDELHSYLKKKTDGVIEPATQPEAGRETITWTQPPTPRRPIGFHPTLTYPDGSPVARDEWPDLYRVFRELCEKHGAATKEQLTEAGPFDSRDTARRALEAWLEHGVQVRKAGRAEQFYLPDTTDLDD